MCPCSGLNIDSNDVTDSPEVKHGSARDFIKFVLVEGRGSHFWNGRIFVKNSSFLAEFPLYFHHFAAITCFIYRESSSVNVVHFSRMYICFFRLSGLCPFRLGLFILVEFVLFSLVERCSLLRPPFRFEWIAISFFWAINSYYFIYLLVFFLVFSSRPLCPKQKFFADILRSCGTTIHHVLIVFIVPGKTPAKFVVPGLWAHG